MAKDAKTKALHRKMEEDETENDDEKGGGEKAFHKGEQKECKICHSHKHSTKEHKK